MSAILRDMKFSGDLTPLLIPKFGRYVDNPEGFLTRKLPTDIKFKYKIKSYWLELCLRFRLIKVGFLKALKGEAVGFIGRLYLTHYKSGELVHYGLVSTKVITTAGVNYMRDDFNNNTGSADITNFKFHDSGTGTASEAVGDTTITAAGPARVTGSQAGGTSKHYVTVGTITYSGTLAITEHGIFSASTSGTLWDRSVFAAVNVASGESIQFTYDLTLNDGG